MLEAFSFYLGRVAIIFFLNNNFLTLWKTTMIVGYMFAFSNIGKFLIYENWGLSILFHKCGVSIRNPSLDIVSRAIRSSEGDLLDVVTCEALTDWRFVRQLWVQLNKKKIKKLNNSK